MDYVVVSNKSSIKESWWSSYSQKSAYLVSLKNGSRKLLSTHNSYRGISNSYIFSPKSKYLIWFEAKTQCYLSYNIMSQEIRNISKGITTALGDENSVLSDSLTRLPVGIGGGLTMMRTYYYTTTTIFGT